MIFEFQLEGEDGDWSSLGIARAAVEPVVLRRAALSLRANHGGLLPAGVYRVRVLEIESRWRYAEVDTSGDFRLIDIPASSD
jgi:hypothetical protein